MFHNCRCSATFPDNLSTGNGANGRFACPRNCKRSLTEGDYAQRQCAWFVSEQFLAKAHTAIATPLR